MYAQIGVSSQPIECPFWQNIALDPSPVFFIIIPDNCKYLLNLKKSKTGVQMQILESQGLSATHSKVKDICSVSVVHSGPCMSLHQRKEFNSTHGEQPELCNLIRLSHIKDPSKG